MSAWSPGPSSPSVQCPHDWRLASTTEAISASNAQIDPRRRTGRPVLGSVARPLTRRPSPLSNGSGSSSPWKGPDQNNRGLQGVDKQPRLLFQITEINRRTPPCTQNSSTLLAIAGTSAWSLVTLCRCQSYNYAALANLCKWRSTSNGQPQLRRRLPQMRCR